MTHHPPRPWPRSPIDDAVDHLLDTAADIVEDDAELTLGLLTEGARCACEVFDLDEPDAFETVLRQALTRVGQAYLASHACDHRLLDLILDQIAGQPMTVQAGLLRTAASADLLGSEED